MTDTDVNLVPETWRYYKLDLFNNASDQELQAGKNDWAVTLNVLLAAQGEYQRFTAKFNSPRRMVKRGTKEMWLNEHYQLVQSIMQQLDAEGLEYRVSKFYNTTRDTVYGLTGFLILSEEHRKFVLVYKQHVMPCKFENTGLSINQRRSNCVGTYSYSQGKFTSNKRIWAGDLLG